MQLSSIKSNSSKKWHASRIKQRKSIELTYRSNSDSDYTEKIQELDRNFDYDDNLNYYWTDPEQSLLYGTPLYEVASSTQKKLSIIFIGLFRIIILPLVKLILLFIIRLQPGFFKLLGVMKNFAES